MVPSGRVRQILHRGQQCEQHSPVVFAHLRDRPRSLCRNDQYPFDLRCGTCDCSSVLWLSGAQSRGLSFRTLHKIEKQAREERGQNRRAQHCQSPACWTLTIVASSAPPPDHNDGSFAARQNENPKHAQLTEEFLLNEKDPNPALLRNGVNRRRGNGVLRVRKFACRELNGFRFMNLLSTTCPVVGNKDGPIEDVVRLHMKMSCSIATGSGDVVFEIMDHYFYSCIAGRLSWSSWFLMCSAPARTIQETNARASPWKEE